MSKICAFFGHRNSGDHLIPALRNQIEKHITERKVDTFYIGGYGGFDGMASAILWEMKKQYSHICVYHILAYMPGAVEKEPVYRHPTIFPAGLEMVPRRLAISRRNCWMVEQADYIIGYALIGGGAYNALDYARRKKKNIINLADMNGKRQ